MKGRDGKLHAQFRQAFELLAVTNERVAKKRLMKVPEEEIRCEWSAMWDTFRTLCAEAEPVFRNAVAGLQAAQVA